MNLDNIIPAVKKLLLKEVKRIFKLYHIKVSKYKLDHMTSIEIVRYTTRTRQYDGYISNIVFVSKENTILKYMGENEKPGKYTVKMALGNASFVYRNKKLKLQTFQLDFN